MSREQYEQWFRGIEVVRCDDDRLELGVKNRFYKNRMETRYLDAIHQAAQACLGRPVAIAVVISPRLYAQFREARDKAMAEPAVVAVHAPELEPPEATPVSDMFSGMPLNPDFTFDTFVVGASNRLAQAVAMRAVEAPGEYGRLYFCGEHGVGKTHLLQAVCHEAKRLRPDCRVLYITCERFVADFGTAHGTGVLRDFRELYRNCDLLALDQLQALGQGSKTATQAELIGIIDEMDARGKQAVFAATGAPGELSGVDPRLRDRLGAGFVDRLVQPDESARRLLIARKLEEKGIRLPGEAVDMVARETDGNILRLEGMINRLAALIDVGGMPPNLSCLRMALEVSAPSRNKSPVKTADIVAAVAGEFGLVPEAVTGRDRAAPARRARAVAVVLCRRLLHASYAEIGEHFARRSHATVISILKKAPVELFLPGLESKPVERILFRLGVHRKPETLLEQQGNLFPGEK